MPVEAAELNSVRDDATVKIVRSANLAWRWWFYGLVIVVVAGQMVGRIAQVKSRDGQTPFLSANDRSRWATIRSLVDEGTFELDRVIVNPETGKWDKRWHSIDLVRHRGSDGKEHYYSSKPTLLSVLLAGEYWLVKQVTGIQIADRPFYIGRIMLVLTNVLPFLAMLWLLARWLEENAASDWTRLLMFSAAAFATPLTTFAVTLNNHSPAAIAALIAVLLALHIAREPAEAGSTRYGWAGLSAAFAASCELPALSLFALLGAILFLFSPRKTLVAYLPAGALIGLAAVGTNYLAHQNWKPPYAHRKDGPVLAKLPDKLDSAALSAGKIPPELAALIAEHSPAEQPLDLSLTDDGSHERWIVWDAAHQRRWVISRDPSPGESFSLRGWDNWYEFDGSYWSSGKLQGVDQGEPSRLTYAFHATFGHHGIFSLTPLWLFAFFGLGLWLCGRDRMWQGLAASILLLTFVCFAFYLSRGQIDRNYGGVSCTFRWMMWFIPLWLLALAPAAQALSTNRWGRAALIAALLVGVFSATYNALNPWTHPWLFDYWTNLGWIDYS